MGIGGGFLLVPMLIYFLRVPTATVIGTLPKPQLAGQKAEFFPIRE